MDTWFNYRASDVYYNEYCQALTRWGKILSTDGDFLKSERCRKRILQLLPTLIEAGYTDLELCRAGMVRGVGCIADLLEKVE